MRARQDLARVELGGHGAQTEGVAVRLGLADRALRRLELARERVRAASLLVALALRGVALVLDQRALREELVGLAARRGALRTGG